MAFKTIFKYGIPFSFVYCTIYQQNIWREGDEHLVEEQKRVWRDFFNMIDTGYQTTVAKINPSSQQKTAAVRTSLVSKFDSLDVRNCWNCKVLNTFATIDQVVANPKVIACKVYRKLQPYISSKSEVSKPESKMSG